MTKDKRLIISMKPSEHKELKVLSSKQEKTMNFIVNQALREFIIKHTLKKEEEKND